MGIEIRDYAVEVFALNMLLHGHVQSGRRLTDMVNESEPYIALDDVHIFPYQADAMLGLGEHRHGLVNKASIVLITELEQRSPAGAGQPSGVRVIKEPHRVLVYADQFAINADIHLVEGIDLTHMLSHSGTRFIPVTNATVTPTQPGSSLTSFRRDFMLVNADQIRYLGVAEVPAAATKDTGDLIG